MRFFISLLTSEIVDLEDQIDQLVYKLYGLTPEEVGIVEKDSN